MAWMRSISKIFRKKPFEEKGYKFLGEHAKDIVQQKIREGMSPEEALKAGRSEALFALFAEEEAHREAHATPEALQRRQRSESILRAEGVPLTKKPLPTLPTETEAKRRSKKEVAYRAMALLAVAVKGEGVEHSKLLGFIMQYGLQNHFSPKEMEFIQNPAPSVRDRCLFDWRYEAAWTLLWALGFVDKLDRPSKVCDAALAMRMVLNCDNQAQFIKDGELRPMAEILDQADLIYRYHWAVRNASISGTPVPEGLHPDVVEERHYTLNWLHQDEEWDNITTDT